MAGGIKETYIMFYMDISTHTATSLSITAYMHICILFSLFQIQRLLKGSCKYHRFLQTQASGKKEPFLKPEIQKRLFNEGGIILLVNMNTVLVL